MDSSPVARSNVRYLPTEIVHQILCSIENEEGDAEIDLRQSTLYACCLVSKQWYSEAISMLYKNPYIDGSRFQQFAATVCPPLGTREPKYRLASLVRRLDMSGLVHQSSNSVTARLLGRVRTNLEAFTAPMYSFSEMSLSPLAKCSKLRVLDLFLVRSRIGSIQIRKAISRLQNLRYLRLPNCEIVEVTAEKDTSWPPLLAKLDLSGHLPLSPPEFITWPPRLSTLSLIRCDEIQTVPLCHLLKSLESCSTLKRLIITDSPGRIDEEGIVSIPLLLPQLTFLSIPGQYLSDFFFETLTLANTQTSPFSSPIRLRTLEFGYSPTAPLQFSMENFLTALRGKLSNVRQIGFHEVWFDEQSIADEVELEEVLISNAEARAKVAAKGDVSAIAEQDSPDIEPGVYYFNDEHYF